MGYQISEFHSGLLYCLGCEGGRSWTCNCGQGNRCFSSNSDYKDRGSRHCTHTSTSTSTSTPSTTSTTPSTTSTTSCSTCSSTCHRSTSSSCSRGRGRRI